MTSNRPAGRPSSGRNLPPTSRRSARQQRLANREANRAITHASTRGSGGGGLNSVLGWTLVAVVIAVVLIGTAFLLSQSKSGVSGAPNPPGLVVPSTIASNERTLGNANAPVTLDLYGDFRCTFCLDFTVGGTEKNIIDNYVATGKAKLVWHDFLTIDHGDGSNASRDAANAAWCGADQGKFWTTYDWLYANQAANEAASAFTKSRLSEIGKAAGLEMSKFQPCLDQGTHNDAIASEQSNIPKDVGGTPALLVNGKVVVPPAGKPLAYEYIKAAIDGVGASPAPSVSAAAPPASAVPSVNASAKPS